MQILSVVTRNHYHVIALARRWRCLRVVCRILLVVLLLSASVVPGALAQQVWPIQLKHFEEVGTVKFDIPDTLLIASIYEIDIDLDGRFLVTDKLGDQILLFDSTGTLLATLDPRICHPGLAFSPAGARFGSDEYILVLNANAGHWGYRFTTDGACMDGADRNFVKPAFLDIDPAGTIYGVYDGPHWEMETKRARNRRMSVTGKPLEALSVPLPKYPNASDRFGDGGLLADGINIFFAWAPETEIMKMTLDGKHVGRLKERGRWFRTPPRDLPRELSPQLFAALRKWSETTTTRSIFELTDQTLMIQYINGTRGTGYQVFAKDGELVAEELGLGGLVFIHGENGLVYRVVQSGLDSRGELPNPYLMVYRFVAP